MTNYTFIMALIDSLLVSSLFVVSNEKILKTKIPKTIKSFLSFCVLIIVVMVSGSILDNAFKVMAIYIATVLYNKIVFKKNIIQCACAGLFCYLLLVGGELFISIFVSIIIKLNLVTEEALTSILKGNIYFNLLIILSSYLIMILSYKKIRDLIINIKDSNKYSYLFAFSILLIAICALLYNLFSNDYKFNEIFVINILLILAVSYIGFIIIKQIYDKNKLSDEYERYVDYSKQSEKLVEEYSMSQHENKNELIIIRSMVHKNNKQLLEYLDEIIKHKDDIEFSWIRYLRYIPFGGLKGIIHNKVSEMKEKGIKVYLNISSDIEKSELRKLTMKENNHLSKIIGVFLDNAIDAAILAKEKEIYIDIYVNRKDVIFEIANSYDGELEIDRISEPRYTSKGKGRGYGLTLVKSLLKENKRIINETSLRNNCFVQIIKIKNGKNL